MVSHDEELKNAKNPLPERVVATTTVGGTLNQLIEAIDPNPSGRPAERFF
jgi:hypothetical protein